MLRHVVERWRVCQFCQIAYTGLKRLHRGRNGINTASWRTLSHFVPWTRLFWSPVPICLKPSPKWHVYTNKNIHTSARLAIFADVKLWIKGHNGEHGRQLDMVSSVPLVFRCRLLRIDRRAIWCGEPWGAETSPGEGPHNAPINTNAC